MCRLRRRARPGDFLRQVTAILAGVAGSLRIGPARLASLPIAFARGLPTGAEEASYPIPGADGVTIDKEREVILARYEQSVYAFALSCPHQKTPLRWHEAGASLPVPQAQEQVSSPTGSFSEGRATRNMDRYAIRREGDNVRRRSRHALQRGREPGWLDFRGGARLSWQASVACPLAPAEALAQSPPAAPPGPAGGQRSGLHRLEVLSGLLFQVPRRRRPRHHGRAGSHLFAHRGGWGSRPIRSTVDRAPGRLESSAAPDQRMRGFEDLLDQNLIDALYAYVRVRSEGSWRRAAPTGAPPAQ